jgi:hypothetical protein
MKSLALVAVAAGAAVALTACSQSAPPPAVSASHAATVSCPKQYDAWLQGPARSVVAAMDAVESAITAKDMPARRAALKKAKPAVVTAARYPIPACADPSGYWTALLMHVNAAVSTSGLASVAQALEPVPAIKRQLSRELKSTAGVS